MGIRYLEIRVKYCDKPDSKPNIRLLQSVTIEDNLIKADGLCIYHGVIYGNLNLNDVMDQIKGFL